MGRGAYHLLVQGIFLLDEIAEGAFQGLGIGDAGLGGFVGGHSKYLAALRKLTGNTLGN